MPPQTLLPSPAKPRLSPEHPDLIGEIVAQSPLVVYATWERYINLDLEFQDSGTRVRFLKPLLEIMPPISEDHEEKKKHHACLIEAWCIDRGIELFGRGSTTLKIEGEAGGEPDESYCFDTPKKRPDLAIEIALTSGGLSKRAFYARFEVPEIWIWRAGKLEVHALENGDYFEVAESRVLPGLDIAALEECAGLPSITQAVKAFREKTIID